MTYITLLVCVSFVTGRIVSFISHAIEHFKVSTAQTGYRNVSCAATTHWRRILICILISLQAATETTSFCKGFHNPRLLKARDVKPFLDSDLSLSFEPAFSLTGLSLMFCAPPVKPVNYSRKDANHRNDYSPRPYTLTSLSGLIFSFIIFSFSELVSLPPVKLRSSGRSGSVLLNTKFELERMLDAIDGL